jgi:hypothetical protein
MCLKRKNHDRTLEKEMQIAMKNAEIIQRRIFSSPGYANPLR